MVKVIESDSGSESDRLITEESDTSFPHVGTSYSSNEMNQP
jgi:hypothetical protein